MFFDILKRDLKRKKTMNVIILLFVILSVMFISSSVMNLTAVTGSLDSFFDKAGVGDYVVFERSGGTVKAADAVKNAEGVTDFKQEECIFLSGHKFVGRAKEKDSQNANTSIYKGTLTAAIMRSPRLPTARCMSVSLFLTTAMPRSATRSSLP